MSVILWQRAAKPYKLLIFFTISVIFLKMGKHSDFQISSFQVVDAWRILQLKRKTKKYFKEFILFLGTLSQNYRRLYGSLTMFQESYILILVQLWQTTNLNMTFCMVVLVYPLV